MQLVRSNAAGIRKRVGASVRTIAFCADPTHGLSDRLEGFGCFVEQEQELFIALDAILSDPSGYGLFVIDADSLGGVEAARQATRLLGDLLGRLPIIVFSNQCREAVLSEIREEPIILPASPSEAVLQDGIEHALRHRSMVFG